MYKVELVNRQSLEIIKEIEIVNEPVLNEEINAAFTFDFEAHYGIKANFNHEVLIKVDGQYFQIIRLVKNRQNSLSLSVQCEHVSYELIDEEDGRGEYEDTAEGMLHSILSGTRFHVGECINTFPRYYKPATREVRQRLIDVANLFGGELVFDNFNVSLVKQRGSDKGLKVELGVNLLGVTEEIDFVEGTTAYELNLVDLAEVAGYELDFSTAEIGDTIQIIDPELGIQAAERILSIQWNPFKPQLPVVTVGDYIRDLTEYIKEKEEKDEENDPRANYYLEKFRIGDIDCLDFNGVEVDNDKALPEGISANIDFIHFEKWKGVTLELKPKYKDYHITVYKALEDGGFETLDYKANQMDFLSWTLPTEGIEGIGVLVTPMPFDAFDADKDDFKQYGVNFNRVTVDVFREFKIGQTNALGLSGIELFPEAALPDEMEAEIKYKVLNEHSGLFLSLKKAYRDWHVELTTYDDKGVPTNYNFTDIEDAAKTWTFPSLQMVALSVKAMEKPPGEFVEGEHLQQTYAVIFTEDPLKNETGLSEFTLGETDCLSLEEVKLNSLDEVPSAIVEFSSLYELELTLQLKKEFKDSYLSVSVLRDNSPDVVFTYGDNQYKYPLDEHNNGLRVIISDVPYSQLISEPDKHFYTVYGVKLVKEGTNLDKRGNVWTEWATVPFAPNITVKFTNKYRSVPTVNAQVYGGQSSVNVALIKETAEEVTLYTGVTISCSGSGESISMHIIGRT